MDAIRIEGLTKKYKDVVAVDNLNLSVKQGEIFSLLGVNGAGKTTTIKMLSCITRPTSGDAFLMGKSLSSEASTVKSLIALSPQETAVAPGLTVQENLALMAGVHGCGIGASLVGRSSKSNFSPYLVGTGLWACYLCGGYPLVFKADERAVRVKPLILFLCYIKKTGFKAESRF